MQNHEPITDISPASLRKLNDQIRFLYYATRNVRSKDIRQDVFDGADLSNNPALIRLPTTDEKNALKGTQGSPSDSNRYVTAADSSQTDKRDPNVHGNEAHFIGYIDDQHPALTDNRYPLEHGNEVHKESYVDQNALVLMRILGL